LGHFQVVNSVILDSGFGFDLGFDLGFGFDLGYLHFLLLEHWMLYLQYSVAVKLNRLRIRLSLKYFVELQKQFQMSCLLVHLNW
jgi:hypothetical protein